MATHPICIDIEQSFNVIETLHCKMEYANFTFEDFVTQLTRHYNTFKRCEEFVSEETKVRSLLRKITNPTLEAAKQAIRINEDYKSNFALAANFISSSITPLSKGRDCNRSTLKQSQHGNNKQRNRNSQCGGRGGRDGHGRGCGRGRE